MDCEYTIPEDVLIDAIIAGVRHMKVQEILLDQVSDLTLAKALSISRQYANSQKQLKLIRERSHMYMLHRRNSTSINPVIIRGNTRGSLTSLETRAKNVADVGLTRPKAMQNQASVRQ